MSYQSRGLLTNLRIIPDVIWECDYGHWNDLYVAVLNHVAASPPEAWSDEALRAILHAIARDDECQYLAHEVRLHHPATLIALTRAALSRGEQDARGNWPMNPAISLTEATRRSNRIWQFFAASRIGRRSFRDVIELLNSVTTSETLAELPL